MNFSERPSGLAVSLINPVTGEPVVFDECRERDGTMIEAKGPGYTERLANAIIAESLAEKWVKQATSQPQASEGRGLEWFFAEEKAADKAHEIFNKNRTICGKLWKRRAPRWRT